MEWGWGRGEVGEGPQKVIVSLSSPVWITENGRDHQTASGLLAGHGWQAFPGTVPDLAGLCTGG